MQYPIKSASLSRHALTCYHGRLLQDSGFTERGSTPNSYADLAHTFTNLLGVSSYQSRTVTGRLSSGKPAMQSIPRVDPSTSVQASLATGSTQSIGRITATEIRESMARWMEEVVNAPVEPFRLCLPKTSYQRLKSLCLEAGTAMPSWVHLSDSIPLPSLSPPEDRCTSGLTPMMQAALRHSRYSNSYGLSASKLLLSLRP